MGSLIISIGNFFFRHRNWAFPALVGGLFAVAIPPADLFGSETLEGWKDVVAVVIAVSGLALRAMVIGYVHIRRAGSGRTIHAAELHRDGIYALCRNPLYTGNILIFLGIFLMHGNIWTLTLGLSCYVFIYYAIVMAEEAYLLGAFGEAYAEYRARVPRWMPNIFRLRAATKGMRFDLRRAIIVEYPNIGVTAAALTFAEFYEELEEPVTGGHMTRLAVLAGILLVCFAWLGLLRFARKRGLILARSP